MNMEHDYKYYIGEARKAEERSHGLWKGINQCIRSVLEAQQKRGVPLKDMPGILHFIAGPKKKSRIIEVDNLRIAARQIKADEEFSVPLGDQA